jgi:hypothetical protein
MIFYLPWYTTTTVSGIQVLAPRKNESVFFEDFSAGEFFPRGMKKSPGPGGQRELSNISLSDRDENQKLK